MTQSTQSSIAELKEIARRVRGHILRMTHRANSGHPGGSLSSVEIITSLYFGVMRHDPASPAWPERDRFVMSKGHATPVLYGVLAEAGYFPVEDLETFRKLGGRLQGHTVMGKPPGIEMSAGALGMGLSFSLGQALSARLGGPEYRVFCLSSDGDEQEGQTWEAAMAAGHHKAGNLTVIVDRNHIQNDGYSDSQRFSGDGERPDGTAGGWVRSDGHTANIMNLEPLEDKWRAFGWETRHIPDGHDYESLIGVLSEERPMVGQPLAAICETVKGRGVSFMENNPDFHGKAPTTEELEQGLRELGFEA